MMELRPIKTEADYQAALTEIELLFDAELNSPECDYLDILATLVEDYEKEHYCIEPPDPIEAISYYLETKGLSEKDLQRSLGNQGDAVEILNHKQALNLELIRALHQDLGISADILIQPYSLA